MQVCLRSLSENTYCLSTEDKYRFTNKEMLIELLDFSTEEFIQLCIKGRDFPRQILLKSQITELQQELRSRNDSHIMHKGKSSTKSAQSRS